MAWFDKLLVFAFACGVVAVWVLATVFGISFVTAMALWIAFYVASVTVLILALVVVAYRQSTRKRHKSDEDQLEEEEAARRAKQIEMILEMLQRHQEEARRYSHNQRRHVDQVRPHFDPYATLGVSREASWNEIQKAYRAKVRLYHPDVAQGGKSNTAKFTAVTEAYEYLERQRKRAH